MIEAGLVGSKCPGRENCLKYKAAINKETVCEHCPYGSTSKAVEDIEESAFVLPWLSHLFYLDGLHRVGATFSLCDLSKSEWDGLLLLEKVRAKISSDEINKREREQKILRAKQRR